MANKTISSSSSKLNELQVNTSTYGRPIYLVYGRNRITPNMLDYQNFRSHTQKSSSSK
jgi:hypothetical protein